MKKSKRTPAYNPLIRIGVYGLLLFSLVFLVTSVRETQDTRGRATGSVRFGPALAAPSLRLSTPPSVHGPGSTIPVTVSVDTGGKETAETRVVVTYDPELLDISRDDIVSSGLYPVINVESAGGGRIEASFFVTAEAGYAPVAVTAEQAVAKFTFRVRDHAQAVTQIRLEYDGTDPELSGIFTPPEKGGEITNILNSTEGLRIFLTK